MTDTAKQIFKRVEPDRCWHEYKTVVDCDYREGESLWECSNCKHQEWADGLYAYPPDNPTYSTVESIRKSCESKGDWDEFMIYHTAMCTVPMFYHEWKVPHVTLAVYAHADILTDPKLLAQAYIAYLNTFLKWTGERWEKCI